MEKSLLTEVKAILKSLVLSCPEKITIEKLNRDYRDVEGQFIPFRQLGYANLEQFLRSIPDTIMVFGNGPTAMVCFVANEKSDHIHDMIMKQKKPKSNARKKYKKNTSHPITSFQRSNRINANSREPTRIMGQQLSPYQSVNRNHMAKTIQVSHLPQLMQTPNCVPTFLHNQTLYTLPQPHGVLLNTPLGLNYQFNPVLSSIKNGIVKAVDNLPLMNRINENMLNSMLKKQCTVTGPPPPLPRSQTRNVLVSSEKISIQKVQETGKKLSNEKCNEIKKSMDKSTEATILLDNIKPPTVKKQNVKLSEAEDLLTMPKLSKVYNPIKENTSSFNEVQKEENVQNIKPENQTKNTRPKTFFDDSADKIEDPDEAVPSFAAKNNVFRLDFPDHTVTYGHKITPYKLPDDVTVGSLIKIFITEIHSPFKFWFHIHKESNEVDLLMNQIESYYSKLDSEDLRIPTICLTPGQICAASYNGLWHRAEIVAPPVNKKIKVSFMDYGTVAEIEIEKIKFLASVFAQLPAQALRGCLSNIKPIKFHWSHEATTYFLRLVEELMLYAKITEINTQKNILYMILCDTNGDEVIQINKSLVDNQYACYNEEWKPEKIKQNNGERIHHPREDFPTFSMIESGEYPSFRELVSLQERGIDYEAIYDLILYNQSTILNKHESASEGLRNLPYFLTTSNPFRSDVLLELYATTSKVI